MNRLIQGDQAFAEASAAAGRLPLPGSLLLGHVGGTRLAVGWSLPVFVVVAVVAGWLLRTQPGNADLPVLAGILAAATLCGAALQAMVRLAASRLIGAVAEDLTLRAFGAWGHTRGVFGPWRMLLAAAAPLASLAAAVGLAAMPPGNAGWAGFSFVPPELVGRLSAVAVLSSCVWLLLVQAAVQCIPLPGCHGREMVIGLVETVSGRAGGLAPLRLLRWLLSGVAVMLLAAAVALLAVELPGQGIPRWPFLVALSVAVWVTRWMPPTETNLTFASVATARPLASPRAPGMSDPPMSLSLPLPPPSRPRRRQRRGPVRWISHWVGTRRVRAAQRRERTEAVDAARLDVILDRLHHQGIDSLAADERAVLRRVSERLKKMREDARP